jgi:hypothetical protein
LILRRADGARLVPAPRVRFGSGPACSARRTLSFVGYAAAGLLAAGAIATFVFWPASSDRVVLAPTVAPGHAGAVLRARF